MDFDLEDFIAEIQKRYKEHTDLDLSRYQVGNSASLYLTLEYMNWFDDNPVSEKEITYKVEPSLLEVLNICRQNHLRVCLKCLCNCHVIGNPCFFEIDIRLLLKQPEIVYWNNRTQPRKTKLKLVEKIPMIFCAHGKNCLNITNGCQFMHTLPRCSYGDDCRNYAEGGSLFCPMEH